MLGLALILLNRLAGLALPAASKFLVDDVIGKGDTELLRLLLAGVTVAIAVQSFSSFFLTKLLSVEAQHLISLLRAQVQRHIIYLPIRFFDNTKSGELVSRIMTDVEGVRNLVGTGLVHLFGGVLTAIGSLFFLFRISVLMTLYTLVPLTILGLISLKAFGYIRPIFRERGKINADVTGRLAESLGGIPGSSRGSAPSARRSASSKRAWRGSSTTSGSPSPPPAWSPAASTLLLGLASVGIMGLGSSMILEGEMTVGDFVSFTLFLGFLIAPIVQMGNIGSQITEAFAGLDRSEEILTTAREDDDPGRTVVLDDVDGHVVFQDVTFSYDPGNPVLKKVSFDAPAGSVTALVGSSGSGKTTLAGLAASFLKPDRGRVMVDGRDLSTVTLNSYRSRLGVVLQDDFLYEGTIRENILFGRPQASEEEVLEAVRASHVKEFTDHFDQGLETLIGERGVKLSGGQRQRVSIARALLADPRILILDEATSNLDTESELYIQQSLAGLMRGRTTFVIAHRLSTIRQAHQILVVEAGEIVERGGHEELIRQQGRYYQLYTYQARI